MSDDAARLRLLMHLRRQGVADTAVLAALERVPRAFFVPEGFKDLAWEDTAIPIGYGQTISQPLVVALMCQALGPDDRLTVLEVGTGSGYQTAILARLFRRVYTVELVAALGTAAAERLAAARVTNLVARIGDGHRGWPEREGFDRIVVAAAPGTSTAPPALVAQLKPGGRLVIPLLGPGDVDHVTLIVRHESGAVSQQSLFPVRFVPLVDSLAKQAGDLDILELVKEAAA